MKILSILYVSMIVLINTGCDSNVRPRNSDIIGDFIIELKNKKSSLTLQLKCKTESYCKLITITQRKNRSPNKNVQYSNDVSVVDNLKIASNALKYAIDRKDVKLTRVLESELMHRLSPSFSKTQSLDRCWDLGIPEERFTLVCTFKENNSKNKPVYLFVTDMGGTCGRAFCRFKIYPMTRR